jgi:hypothetical protein
MDRSRGHPKDSGRLIAYFTEAVTELDRLLLLHPSNSMESLGTLPNLLHKASSRFLHSRSELVVLGLLSRCLQVTEESHCFSKLPAMRCGSCVARFSEAFAVT